MQGRAKGTLGLVGLGLWALVACEKAEEGPNDPLGLDDGHIAGRGDPGNDAGAENSGAYSHGGGGASAGGAPVDAQAGMGGGSPSPRNPVAPVYPGFTLVIEEHFDEPLDLNTDPLWTWSDGGSYFDQTRFVEDAITFADGTMRIVTDEPASPVPASHSFAESMTVTSRAVISGELRTRFNNYRYGRYEARIKAPLTTLEPSTTGNFISSFLVTRPPRSIDWREITIDITGGVPDGVLTNVIFATNAYEYGMTKNAAVFPSLGPNFVSAGQFHDYAFVWKADSVSWFVDGELVRSYGLAEMTESSGPTIPDLSSKIMLSTRVFNSSWAYGGSMGQLNAYPFTTEVDFIRFYKEDGEIYPCDAPPACLPAEDLHASKNNPKETDTEG